MKLTICYQVIHIEKVGHNLRCCLRIDTAFCHFPQRSFYSLTTSMPPRTTFDEVVCNAFWIWLCVSCTDFMIRLGFDHSVLPHVPFLMSNMVQLCFAFVSSLYKHYKGHLTRRPIYTGRKTLVYQRSSDLLLQLLYT